MRSSSSSSAWFTSEFKTPQQGIEKDKEHLKIDEKPEVRMESQVVFDACWRRFEEKHKLQVREEGGRGRCRAGLERPCTQGHSWKNIVLTQSAVHNSSSIVL